MNTQIIGLSRCKAGRTFTLAGLAVVGMSFTNLAAGQEESSEPSTLDEIVVTGSHIRRTEYEGLASGQTLDRSQIDDSGADRLVDVLDDISSNIGSQKYFEGDNRQGMTQFNVRGLGAGSTLTLLNGKRVGNAPLDNGAGAYFVDINQFPLAMVERVEVLTNGASATYGSQAVGGVANIITRKGFEGFELSGGYTTSEFDAYNLNIAMGSQFDQGGFNVYATYYNQDNAERSDFDFIVDRLQGQGDPSRSQFLSTTGTPGVYTRATLDANNLAVVVPGLSEFPDPDCEAAGGVFPEGDSAANLDRCRFDFGDQVSTIPKEERHQIFAEWDWRFSDKLKYYGEASFSNNVIERSIVGQFVSNYSAAGGFTIDGDHPFNFFIEDADPANPTGLIYIGPENWDNSIHTGATLLARGRPLGAQLGDGDELSHVEIDYVRALNGIELELPGSWYLDASYMWAKSTFSRLSPHLYPATSFEAVVRSGDWNPFGTRVSDPTMISPKDGTSIAANSDGAYAAFDQPNGHNQRTELKVVDLIASGDLFETGSVTLAGAVGAQYREEDVVVVPDALQAAGLGVTRGGAGSALSGGQDVVAAYGEVLALFGDIAELQVAVRYEDFGDLDTTDPKISAQIGATESLSFRGSWGTSFQAPSVNQTASVSSLIGVTDSAVDDGSGNLICGPGGDSRSVTQVIEGSANLKPQSSDNYTVGFIFQTGRFSASIDYWNFDYTDLINPGLTAQAVVDSICAGVPDGQAPLPSEDISRDGTGGIVRVASTFNNVGSVKTDGVDISAAYNMDVGRGSLTLDFFATYANEFEVDRQNGSPVFDGVGSRNQTNGFSTMPEWRGRFGGTYRLGEHAANLTARYVDGYTNDQDFDAEVDSWVSLDAQYSIVLPQLLGDGDTSISLGISNLLDEDPPALRRNNADGTLRTRFDAAGNYDRAFMRRDGYDNRSGVDIRGRVFYAGFKQSF